MSVTRVGKKWVVRKRLQGMKPIYETYINREDALLRERNIERQAGGMAPITRPVTLDAAWAKLEETLVTRGIDPDTIRTNYSRIKVLRRVFGGNQLLSNITDDMIKAYIRQRREERKRKPITNRTLSVELFLLRRLAEESKQSVAWEDPKLVITEHQRIPPTPTELAKMWLVFDPLIKRAVALCATTGMRVSEALRATVADVDREAKVIHLMKRKSGDYLTVALTPLVESLLPTEGKLVPITQSAVDGRIRRASKVAGLSRVYHGPSILGRHVLSTWAVQYLGYTEGQVAEALGHRTKGVTHRYIHAQAVEPIRRPLSLKIEKLLLDAVAEIAGRGEVLPFISTS